MKTTWFYAVMVEAGTVWSTAQRSANEGAARKALAERFPFATILALER